MAKDVIQESLKTIQELDRLHDSDNIKTINQLCNKLSNLAVNVGKLVSDAEKLFNELEDIYDVELEKKKLELVDGGMGIGKSESTAIVALADKKKDYRKAEDGYKRLKRFLERLDKVLDSNKQYTSTVKSSNLKNV